jgi:hypothetical protein
LGLSEYLGKQHSHFLTINFKDEAGKEQIAVFQIGKDIQRATLAIIETRSGKKIE